jgi:hypothetical protein
MKREIRAGQEHLMVILNTYHERMMVCLGKMEAMDLKANLEEIESESEHWDVLQEVAAVKSLGTTTKRHRDRHVAAGQCGEPKELTPGDCGSRSKLAAACKKVSRCAGVAWRKRIIVRKDLTRNQVECGAREG